IARFEAWRSDDGKARFPFEDVIGFEDEKGQAGDVVGMKMGDQDCLDFVAVDRKLVHRNERGRATIDERVEIATDEMETGIESSARPERVAATHELQLHEKPSI